MAQDTQNTDNLFFPFKKRGIGLLFLAMLVLGLAFMIWAWKYAYPFLAIQQPLEDPDMVIVEGWLPYHALKQVYEEVKVNATLKVLVSGADRGHREVTLGGHPQSTWHAYVNQQIGRQVWADTLSINFWGNIIAGEKGKVLIQVNGRKLKEAHIEKGPLVWKLPLYPDSISKLTVRMLNTNVGSGQELRRIYFKEVWLDSLSIPLYAPFTTYAFASYSDSLTWFETPQYKNAAIFAGNMMHRMGLDTSRIVILPVSSSKGSRTLSSAQAVGDWIMGQGVLPSKVNLYSQAAHTRRSFEIYRDILPDSIQLGAIALRDYQYDENWTSTPTGRHMMLEQIVKYFISKILFY